MPSPIAKINILMVKDDTRFSGTLKREMSRYFEIHTATDSDEALAVLQSNDVDAIVCDAEDGLELCRVIQSRANENHIPFILHSFRKGGEGENGNSAGRKTAEDREFMDRIDSLIEEQISDDSFSIDALAGQMYMSKSNFYRKFHAVTESSPNEYLKNYRLNRAAGMILNGTKINEAAMAMGYSSSSYFAKCFLAKFGVLPKDYLETVRENARDSAQETA